MFVCCPKIKQEETTESAFLSFHAENNNSTILENNGFRVKTINYLNNGGHYSGYY